MVGRPSWVLCTVPHKFYGKSGQALVVVGAGAARPALVLFHTSSALNQDRLLVVVVLSCPVLSGQQCGGKKKTWSNLQIYTKTAMCHQD